MNVTQKLKGRALRWSRPLPFQCRHIEYSTIASVDDDASKANERLMDLAEAAIKEARGIDLSDISDRVPKEWPRIPDIWPGEHYKLLAGMVKVLKPRRVIEIGTYTGLSALAMLKCLPLDSDFITVDVVPWDTIRETSLTRQDFSDGRIKQRIGDLSEHLFFHEFTPEFSTCDLLFIDAPKNVVFETALIRLLKTIKLSSVVVFDDIRQWNMLKIWREIDRPKLDLTSFGHWTGTGLVDWK